MKTIWYLHSHRVCFRLSTSFIEVSLPCDFERFTVGRLCPLLPELSNSASPPAKPGVYRIKLPATTPPCSPGTRPLPMPPAPNSRCSGPLRAAPLPDTGQMQG